MIVFTVKGPVHKLYLRNLFIQEKLKLFFYKLQIAEPKLFINGRKAVAAGKRTASAAFIINDPVCKILCLLIGKGNSA